MVMVLVFWRAMIQEFIEYVIQNIIIKSQSENFVKYRENRGTLGFFRGGSKLEILFVFIFLLAI